MRLSGGAAPHQKGQTDGQTDTPSPVSPSGLCEYLLGTPGEGLSHSSVLPGLGTTALSSFFLFY